MVNNLGTGALESVGQMDHEITSEYRILGPPGTGKTTATSELVGRAIRKYGSGEVLVTSFSRAAAAELADCDLPIGPNQLGTLHSLCFRALGQPSIAEAHVGEWNRVRPDMALTPAKAQGRLEGDDALEEEGKRKNTGDALLQALNRCRGLLLDRAAWSPQIREFANTWNRYKRDLGLLDFCDLIEVCLRDIGAAPGKPSVIFTDEAQDLNSMQAHLIRKWGAKADYYVLAGDDDQTIYSFIGATPEALLEPAVPNDHTVVLRQSHRVPRSIHKFADSLIRRVTRRQEKVYFPRATAGAVQRMSSGSYKSPEYCILASAMKHLESGQKVMFLASCSYMLQPMIQVLRKNGIPFHNPYRKANGLWNPLRVGRRTASRRILALLQAHPQYGEGAHDWTRGDIELWGEWLRSNGVLRCGIPAFTDRRQTVTAEGLRSIFEESALTSLLSVLDGDWRSLLDWWQLRLSVGVRSRAKFPAQVVSQHGAAALIEDPAVIVGTIHSVKGGQADVVYLFPDLSRAGRAQYDIPGPSRDSVIRLFYVGATRARDTLYICQRETASAISM
jgi:superfamily I DNA/RNA helicase